MAVKTIKDITPMAQTGQEPAHVPGLSDYLIETRMMMTEHRVHDCLKTMSDATLNSVGLTADERAQLKSKINVT